MCGGDRCNDSARWDRRKEIQRVSEESDGRSRDEGGKGAYVDVTAYRQRGGYEQAQEAAWIDLDWIGLD